MSIEAEKIVPSDYPNSHQQEPFAVAWVMDGELFWPSEYEVIAQAGDKAIPLYAAPVHASDISQERVDETAKCGREWVGLDDDIPGLGLVTEEFYNGMLCAEDILRKRNTCVEREWVGLTDEEREQVRSSAGYNQFMSAGEYAEAVQWATEAKLKEKNCG